MSMKCTQGSEPVTLTSYCEKHLPVWDMCTICLNLTDERAQKEQTEARLKALVHDNVTSSPNSKLS